MRFLSPAAPNLRITQGRDPAANLKARSTSRTQRSAEHLILNGNRSAGSETREAEPNPAAGDKYARVHAMVMHSATRSHSLHDELYGDHVDLQTQSRPSACCSQMRFSLSSGGWLQMK